MDELARRARLRAAFARRGPMREAMIAEFASADRWRQASRARWQKQVRQAMPDVSDGGRQAPHPAQNATGSYREDVGANDSIDKSLGTAVAHAMKGAVTDAMKRAARHFGEKLGNSLYDSKFKLQHAPVTLRQALETYELDRNKATFFEKDRTRLPDAAAGTGTATAARHLVACSANHRD